MSVDQLLKIQEVLKSEPTAYVLVANSIWQRAEHYAIVAIFDTLEMVEAYEKAAQLPDTISEKVIRSIDTYTETGKRVEANMFRSYRPDSLLWDCNKPEQNGAALTCSTYGILMVSEARIGDDYSHIPQNPEPPSGPIEWPDDIRLDDESKEKIATW